jgi:hypothetical protein
MQGENAFLICVTITKEFKVLVLFRKNGTNKLPRAIGSNKLLERQIIGSSYIVGGQTLQRRRSILDKLHNFFLSQPAEILVSGYGESAD